MGRNGFEQLETMAPNPSVASTVTLTTDKPAEREEPAISTKYVHNDVSKINIMFNVSKLI